MMSYPKPAVPPILASLRPFFLLNALNKRMYVGYMYMYNQPCACAVHALKHMFLYD